MKNKKLWVTGGLDWVSEIVRVPDQVPTAVRITNIGSWSVRLSFHDTIGMWLNDTEAPNVRAMFRLNRISTKSGGS